MTSHHDEPTAYLHSLDSSGFPVLIILFSKRRLRVRVTSLSRR